jgi:hypothetical protein
MAKKKTPEEIAAQIVKILFDAGAPDWSVQDKGILLAAVKQQLAEKERE